MQVKWGIAIFGATILSGIVASAALAAPISSPHAVSVPRAMSTPPPVSGSGLSLAPLMTATETLTPTVVPTTTVVPTSTLSPGNEKIAQAIAGWYGVSEDKVLDIHDMLHGWGGVFFAFALAQKSGESAQDIAQMKLDGEGWGQITMDLGFKPGNHGNNLGHAVSGKATPTAAPSLLAPTGSSGSSDDQNCKGNPNNKGKGNPCPQAGSTPLAPTNSNGNSNGNGNGNGNNNNGNGKGKSGK